MSLFNLVVICFAGLLLWGITGGIAILIIKFLPKLIVLSIVGICFLVAVISVAIKNK